MSGMPWLKHYSKKRTDPRVKLLSMTSKCIYYLLSEVAAECDAQGAFLMNGLELTDAQIAELATVEVADYRKAKREMMKTGIMSENGHGPFLVDFAVEQKSQAERNAKLAQYKRDQRKREKISADVRHDVSEDGISDVRHDVSALEERVKSQSIEILLLLSKAQQETLTSQHPEWITEAVELASKNKKPRPTYIAGILRNWLTEGRNNGGKRTHAKPKASNSQRPAPAKPGKAVYSAGDREAVKRALSKRGAKTNVQ